MKIFNRITNSIIGLSILACFTGLLFILNPTLSLESIGVMSAIYLIAHGLVLLILEMRFRIFFLFENLIIGIFSIILGLVLLAKPESISILLGVVVGVWMIVSSVSIIKVSLFFKNIKGFEWIYMLLLGIINIILGFLVILNPFDASIALTLYLGIMLFMHSIFNITNMIILKKNIKNKENFIKDKIKKIIPNIN